MLQVMRSKCVRYTEWKLADKIKKLNVNKHLFCVKRGNISNIVTFLPLWKRLNMSSLIANQVKANMSLDSVILFIVLTTYVPLLKRTTRTQQ